HRYPYSTAAAAGAAAAAAAQPSARGLTASRRLEMEAEVNRFEAELRQDLRPQAPIQQQQTGFGSFPPPPPPPPPMPSQAPPASQFLPHHQQLSMPPRTVYSAQPQIVRQHQPSPAAAVVAAPCLPRRPRH
ncbi:hypothetical protein BOX15_Mlig020824g8, partial [Macrostomum lignano]